MVIQRLVMGCVFTFLVHQLNAVSQSTSDYQWPTEYYYQPVLPLPPSMNESYDHDSTAAGNILRGRASMIHADGNWWLDVSQASILFETAEALRLYNRRQWIAFFTSNLQRIEDDRQKKLDVLRPKNERESLAKMIAAYQLTEKDFDRVSGAINWPCILLADEYREPREELDRLFRRTAADRVWPNENARRIIRSVERFRDIVRCNIDTMPTEEVFSAQRFLCGVKLEVREPLSIEEERRSRPALQFAESSFSGR